MKEGRTKARASRAARVRSAIPKETEKAEEMNARSPETERICCVGREGAEQSKRLAAAVAVKG